MAGPVIVTFVNVPSFKVNPISRHWPERVCMLRGPGKCNCQAAANAASFAASLESEGARQLLLFNVPDLGVVPSVSALGAGADFLQGLESKQPAHPDFRDALETQYVCDAVLKSARTGKWEKVSKLK